MKAEFVGGRYHGMIVDVEEIYWPDGMWNGRWRPDYSVARQKGAIVPRAELDNAPLVDGYLSPMWDGGKIRYETSKVYECMSR